MTKSPGRTYTAAERAELSQEPPDWAEFVAQHSDATIYHDSRWPRLMSRAYGNRPIYLTCRRNNQLTGILQLVMQKSILFGSHLCSLPYFDVSGILADDADSTSDLLDQARRLAQDQRVDWLELRNTQPAADSIPTRTDKVTMHLELPATADDLWHSFSPKVRNQIRKAQKANLQVAIGRAELLDEFYDVYVRNMRDLGSPPHSRQFFSLIVKQFTTEATLYVVRLAGKCIAAGLALTDRQAVHVPWAASDWRCRDLNANMLLYWSMLAEACQTPARHFDFGRSSIDSGAFRFKKQWGAQEVRLVWQFLLPDGKSMPELRPDSPRYQLMVACWKKLPLCLARRLGPAIISQLS